MTRHEAIETLETRTLMTATAAAPELDPLSEYAGAAFVLPLESANYAYGLNPEQKHRAEQITSTFENSTTTVQYAYIQNLHDGRGFTAGRAGFCTGTGDFVEVVRRYTAAVGDNPLSGYLPRLEELAAEWSDATDGLEGIEQAWVAACDDPAFLGAQDSLVDDWYYNPAMVRAEALGLQHAISKAQLYDAIIQHGEGDDPDGLPAMIDRANDRAGGSPATGVDEAAWLGHFLDVRRETLAHASNEKTREEWAQSVDRVDVYIGFLQQGNLELTGELSFTVYGDHFVIPAEDDGGPGSDPDTGTGTLSGRVFIDADEDGIENGHNYGNAWRTVFIDADDDWYLDDDELSTVTDADGNYAFIDLAPGAYNVRLQSVSWYFSTTPIARQVTVAAGQTTHANFGEWVTYRRF